MDSRIPRTPVPAETRDQSGDPRIFQGSPLTEVPLEHLRRRCAADRINRDRAAEVAPGIYVQVLAWGDHFMPDGGMSYGAQIAVWAEPAGTET